MSEPTPYQLLEVDEDASFDEVQEARTRLAEQYSGDMKRLELIEAAVSYTHLTLPTKRIV